MVVLLIFGPPLALAADEPANDTDLQAQIQALEARGEVDAALLEQAEANVRTGQLLLENLQSELESLRRARSKNQQALDQATKALAEAETRARLLEDDPAREAALAEPREQRQLRETEANRLDAEWQRASHRLEGARARLAADQRWLEVVQAAFRRRETQTLEQQTTASEADFLRKATELRAELATLPAPVGLRQEWRQRLLEARVLEAEERAQWTRREGKILHARQQLRQYDSQLTLAADTLREHDPRAAIQILRADLRAMGQLVQRKREVLQRHRQLVPESSRDPAIQTLIEQEQRLIDGLLTDLQTQGEQLTAVRASARALRGEVEKRIREQQRAALFKPRVLPWEAAARESLWAEIVGLPSVLFQQLTRVVRWEDLTAIPSHRWLLALFVGLIWLLALRWAEAELDRRLRAAPEASLRTPSFVASFTRVALRLARMNLASIALLGLMVIDTLTVLPLPANVQWLVINGFALWLGVKMPINLAWLLLAAPDGPAEFRNPRLYLQLRALLSLTGLLSTITLLLHLLPVSTPLRELNDSGYMIFLALLVPATLHLRGHALRFLSARIQSEWLLVPRLLSLFMPISMLAVSLLGMLGYINLGWEVARQLGWFMLLFAAWLVTRGVVNDAVVVAKNFAIRHSPKFGLLWTQDVIPLIHRLVNIGIFLLALGTLFWLNGWQWRSGVFRAVLGYPLLTLGATSITVEGIVMSLLVIALGFWLANWTRRIAYRWIFAGIADLGVRHSLSVFTQYAILLAGGLFTLRALGLDPTSMTVFAGALGVGLGFGMQNIANNFVSGLLVLIERPLRTGDYVNIDGNEGEVTRIGIRSSTIRTWDSHEVIVPNSEVISNAFTNWTHSDNILRTVLMVGVSYGGDPRQAMSAIETVLTAHPLIVADPPPLVTLWEYSDSAVTIRFQYFINLRVASLFSVRSEVLLAVWDAFAREGIEIPFPQRVVHMKTPPQENIAGRSG